MKIIRIAYQATLPQKWVDFLIKEPETGMGWQLLEVRLKSGQTVSDVAATNCEVLTMRNGSGISFAVDDIEGIKVR